MRLGLVGCGTVGGALVRLVGQRRAALAERLGIDLVVHRIAVRDVTARRDVELAPDTLTGDARSVVTDPTVDIVVELMGGLDLAGELVAEALSRGTPVVTGSKDLIAERGRDLADLATRHGTELRYEAAVAGGIPVVRALSESLAGERIERILGILNGTTNYVLTKMTEEGAEYGDVLAEAQRLGYAEADPSADVEGHDAAAKAAILASIAFGAHLGRTDVHVEGITDLTAADLAAAARMDHVIKLLAVIESVDGAVSARVHPALVPAAHPLAAVRDSFNAVLIEGEAVGELMLYGRGAGGAPTASAVLGDVVAVATGLVRPPGVEDADRRSSGTPGALEPSGPRPMPLTETSSASYVPIDVIDRPGVLAAVAGAFGRHGVSIRSMEQLGGGDGAHLALITHRAGEAAVAATLEEAAGLDEVLAVGRRLRVIGDEDRR